MLVRQHKQLGFTMIELMITISILAIVLSLAAPNYTRFIANTQIRSTIESIRNGLQVARGEAIKRNTAVQFTLANGNASSWTVGCVTVVLDLDGDGRDDCPAVIQSKSAREGGSGTITIGDNGTRTLIFNSLGTLNAIAGQMTQVTVDNTAVTAAVSTDLKLLVNAGGTARVCDASVSVTTDSRYC